MLADFDNSTGDAEFDGVMNRVLEIDLNQSPFVSLLSERKTEETLQQMGREKTAKLLYIHAQYEHMQIVTSGKVIPQLLHLTPLKSL